MKARVGFLTLVLAFSGCTESAKAPPGSQASSAPEETYFQTRNRFIQNFEKEPNPSDDRPALSELETQMKALVGPVNIEGFPREGRNNLQTLIKQLGFGQVDGLAFTSGREHLFVTTDEVLNRYLAEVPELPKDPAEASGSGEFYRRIFSADAAVTLYAEVPVNIAGAGFHARAFLGLAAQDIGPFIPTDIYVFASSGSRIFAVQTPSRAEITRIPLCQSEWDGFDKKSTEAYGAYRASGLNDRRALDQHFKFEESGFEAWHRCYDREAKNQEFFESLRNQVQEMAARLKRNQ